jgi:FkbM family methyltransferase
MYLAHKLKGIYLKFYFYFKSKLLFKDKYGLSYYLYKNTRPLDTFIKGVRTDDTTVLYTIDKILSSSILANNNFIQCIDVGGYIGVTTLMMSKTLQRVKKKWKIHTFEPFKDSFVKLQENVNLDPYRKNITLNNCAVSDIEGITSFKTYENFPGENHIDTDELHKYDDFIIHKNIKVITLRDYINKNQIKHINICKIDTEGVDYLVIKGLYEYLDNKFIDYIIYEYHYESNEKIKNILSAKGYSIYYMVRNENTLVSLLENYPENSKSLLNLIAVSPAIKNIFLKNFSIE